jgi:hypothetical protein
MPCGILTAMLLLTRDSQVLLGVGIFYCHRVGICRTKFKFLTNCQEVYHRVTVSLCYGLQRGPTGVTKYFEPGWKLTRGHFSTLNIETKGVEFRPLPVENWTGQWNFDHKPGSKFNSIKHEIFTPTFIQPKNCTPFRILPYCSFYFAFDLIDYYVVKSHSVLTLCSPDRVLSSGLLIYRQYRRVCICFSSYM